MDPRLPWHLGCLFDDPAEEHNDSFSVADDGRIIVSASAKNFDGSERVNGQASRPQTEVGRRSRP
jgi:hypothetical protein